MSTVGGAPVRITPAIGAGGRLPRRILIRRYALALTLILALGLGKILIANKAISTVSLTLPDRVVTSGLIIGAAPADTDLEDFAADFSVDAVVNVGSPSVAEQVTTASLHQQAVTTVAMLLLLRGQTWTAVVNQITPAGLRSLDARQQLALNQLISALHQAGPQGPQGPQSPQSREPSGNPYAAASLEPW